MSRDNLVKSNFRNKDQSQLKLGVLIEFDPRNNIQLNIYQIINIYQIKISWVCPKKCRSKSKNCNSLTLPK